MPAWNDLVSQVNALPDDAARAAWLAHEIPVALSAVGQLRNGRNVLLYGSAFLQRPQAPVSLSAEDINGFMACIYGLDCTKGLTLIIHTPGGSVNAAESVVAYLRSKFETFEVVIPTFAMSAGTMISLASERIVMGRQSQMGPIDPQLAVNGRSVSARAVVDQFERARADIQANVTLAHLWAPVLGSVGPSLLQEAQNALDYGEAMVASWLATGMFFQQGASASAVGKAVAQYFNDAGLHKSHGRRIDRQEAVTQSLVVEELESNQTLQEAVLNVYHLMTIAFEITPTARMIQCASGRSWIRNA